MMNQLDSHRDSNGKLPAYAWPGGYPLFYLDSDNCVLCPDCANESEHGEPNMQPVAYGVNWEDDSLYCEECNRRIESAYGENEE